MRTKYGLVKEAVKPDRIERPYEKVRASFKSKALAQNIKRGMQSNADKGLVTGGRRPYGYKTEGRRLVVDETLRPVVEYIFQSYAAGFSQKQICDYESNKKDLAMSVAVKIAAKLNCSVEDLIDE